jgi:PAS domain S-box-containing protein
MGKAFNLPTDNMIKVWNCLIDRYTGDYIESISQILGIPMNESNPHADTGRRFLIGPWAAATAALIIVVAISFLAYFLNRKSEENQSRAAFQLIATEHLHNLKSIIQSNLHSLETVGAFYNSSDSVTRQEFGSFAAPLLSQHPEIQMLAWIPILHDRQRTTLKASIQTEGVNDFRITEWSEKGGFVQAAKRNEYLPMCYVEPAKNNKELLGFDLASDSVFLEAINWARDQDMITSSEKLDSYWKTEGLSGLVVFLPIYKQGLPLRSVDDRRKHIKGLVCVSYNIVEIIEASLTSKTPRQFDLLIYDLSLPSEERLMYGSTTYDNTDLFLSTAIWHDSTAIAYNAVFNITDKMWLTKYLPSRAFLKNQHKQMSSIIIILGMIIGLLSSVSVLLVLNRSARARYLCRALQATADELEVDARERRKVEKALRSSEDLYRTTIDAMSDSIHVVDRDLKITMINATLVKWCRELGLGEVKAGDCLKDVFPFLTDTIFGEYTRTFESGKILATEEEHKLAGEELVAETIKIPVFENKDVVRVITVIRDITERKKQEEIRRLAKFSIDKNVDAAFWIRQDGSFCYVNQAACHSLGYTRKELLNMTVHDIDPNFPKEKWPKHWQDIEQWRSFKIESIHCARDGHTFPVEVTVNYLEFEGKKYNCAFARDISELKRVNDALENSVVRYNSIIENVDIGIMVISPKMDIVLVNKMMRQWFPEIDLSKRLTCCAIFNDHSIARECHDCPISKAMHEGLDYHDTLKVNISGDEKRLNIRVSPINDEQGQTVAFVTTAEEIMSTSQTVEKSQTAS